MQLFSHMYSEEDVLGHHSAIIGNIPSPILSEYSDYNEDKPLLLFISQEFQD